MKLQEQLNWKSLESNLIIFNQNMNILILVCFRKQDKFMGLSFATISASGPNGSVIHYHPEESTKRRITTNEIYLCDSGAQYLYINH